MKVELTGTDIAIIRDLLMKERMHIASDTNTYKLIAHALESINNYNE